MTDFLTELPEGAVIQPAVPGLDVLPDSAVIDTGPVTSPLDVPKPKEPAITDPAGPMVLGDGITPIPEYVKKAAAAGVLFDRPAPAGSGLASFAYDDENRIAAYTKALRISLGKDVKVRMGQQTGQIEYLDPETNRYALASPTLQGASLQGAGVAIAPEVLGAAAAAILTRSPIAVELGAGGGAFIGEIVRLQIGKGLGINENITEGQIIREGLVAGGIAAASGVALNKLVKFGKFIMDVTSGKAIPRGAADSLDLSMDEAAKVTEEINNRLGAERFRLTLAQATGDEDLLVMQEVFRKSPEFSKQFGVFEEEQRAALKGFYDTINKPYNSRLTESQQVGEAVQGVARSALQREKDRVDVFVAMKEAELRSAITSIRSRPHGDLGESLREIGDVQQTAFTDWARQGAADLNGIAGNAEFIASNETYRVVQDIDARITRALFPSVQKPQRGLIGGPDITPSDIPGEAPAIGNKLFDPNAKFTFTEAWDAISALKKVVRVSSKGLSTDAPEVGAVKRLIGALEKDLDEGAKHSPLREQYQQFIGRYRAEKTRLDEGIVGKIMQRQGPRGRFVIADEAVFRSVFKPNGKREAQELRALIGDDPEAMRGMRESIADFYMKEVSQDGKVNTAAHERFISQYDAPLREFFTKSEFSMLNKPAGIAAALAAREAARKRTLTEINSTFGAKIANLDNPGAVVSLIMDPKNPDKARAMMGMLEKTPDVKRAVQFQVRKIMSERIAGKYIPGSTDRFFNHTRLNDFLQGKGAEGGHAPILRAVFGDQYVDDLSLLDKALSFASRESRHPNTSNTAFWWNTLANVSRAYVGIFTRPGRFLTAASKLRGRAANRVLFNAMMNPKNMREFIQLRGVDLRSQKAMATIGALGGSALFEDFE